MNPFSSLFGASCDLLLGKRRPGEQQGSPAKKAKPEQQQQGAQPGMSHAQQDRQNANGITEVPVGQNTPGYNFPSNGQAEEQPRDQQQAAQQHAAPMQQAKQPEQQQLQQQHHHQQQQPSTRVLDTARSYANVLQTLKHPPVAAPPPDPRAAAARRYTVQHMPLPSAAKPPQPRLQLQQQQQPRAFWQQRQLSDDSTQSPLAYRFSPATGPRPRSRQQQQGRYGTLGAPPPQQQRQQRVRHGSPGLPSAAAAAAGRQAGEVSRTGRPSAVYAAGQGAHRGPSAAAAAAAAAGGGVPRGSSLGARSPSPPLGDVAKQLFDGLDRRSTAAAAAAGRGRQPALRPAGSGWGAGARPSPPPQFASALQETNRDLGVTTSTAAAAAGAGPGGVVDATDVDELLARQAAEKQAALDRAQAKLAEARQLSKHAGKHAQQTLASIDKALPVLSPDYLPNTAASAPALAQLMALTVQREAARLQAEAARVAAREAAARERSLLGARAAEAGAGLQRLPQLQHWRPAPLKSLAQLQQQYEQEAAAAAAGDDEDDDVVIVSSDEGEGGSDQQQYEAEGSESEEEEEGSEAESEEESEEADQAAAGIESLGITTWMAPRANWSCTREQMDRYKQATSRPDDGTVLASHERSKLELAGHDLKTLAPGQWLNDECMNMYIALLQDRDTAGRAAGGLKCHFFNTFFMNKLYEDEQKYKYANVRRWTGEARLKAAKLSLECVLKCDRVIIPVHQGNHWTAMMVDLAQQRLVFFDSFLGQNRRAVANVKQWVMDEAKDKLKEEWDTSSWREEYPQAIPRQTNGVDCGVFALMFCNRMSVRGGGFDFTQQDVSINVRASMVCDLLDGAISATAWGR